MHDKITRELTEIATHLKSAGARHKMLVTELLSLRSENQELQKSKEELENRIRQMEDLIYILKSSVSPLDEESKRDFEKRLNKYLSTINKCIGLLKT